MARAGRRPHRPRPAAPGEHAGRRDEDAAQRGSGTTRWREHGVPWVTRLTGVDAGTDVGSDPVQPAGGLGDGAADRGVDRERLGQLVGGQRLRDRDRDRVDQLAGARGRRRRRRRRSRCRGGRTASRNRRGRPASWRGRCRRAAAVTWSAWISPRSTACCDQPTVAISGAVKTLEETFLRSSGATASPRKCHIAIRPCMAATLASIRTPVQSPAAYTPRAVVRETRSTATNPRSSSVDAGRLEAEPVGVRAPSPRPGCSASPGPCGRR